MNSKQWRLYEFLKQKFRENPDHWVTHQEICDAMPNDFSMNHIAIKKKCCSKIQQNILAISDNDELDKIVMWKNQSYKLAKNKEEASKFNKQKLLFKALRILDRYWSNEDRINNDGQMKLISNRGRVIDEESRAKHFIETFTMMKGGRSNAKPIIYIACPKE